VGNAKSNVGASLLAMAVGQSPKMLYVPASSRAGSLPQGLVLCMDIAAAHKGFATTWANRPP